MIKTYLFDLLKVNSRVIIPDFGAFLVKEKPGGKMEVSFNDFLKFNDGLLANKIIKTENVTKTEAVKKIKEFIKEVEDQMKEGGTFVIENVGKFHKDDFGRIKFEPYIEGKSQEPEKDEKVPEKSIDEKKEEVKEVVKEEKAPETKEAPKDKVKKEAETKEEKKTETKVEEKAKVADVKKKEAPKVIIPEEKKKEASTERKVDTKLPEQITAKVASEPVKKKEVVAEIIDDSETISSKPKQAQSSATLIWVSGVVVIIAALITWAVIDYDRIAGWFDGGDKVVVETPIEDIVPKETVKEGTPVVEETSMEDPVKVETKTVVEEQIQESNLEPVYDGPKYYVIAGSFKVENNAIKYHKRLVNEGYNAENMGLVKGFHMVSFDSFKGLEDAVKMMKMVRADQPDVWVMKY